MTPDASLRDKLTKIKLMAMDVDGTFTDGTIYYDAEGHVTKGFWAHDGMGLELLRRAGIVRGFITGRNDPAMKARADYLGVEFYLTNRADKDDALAAAAVEHGVRVEECLYIGDDLNDIPALDAAGVAVVAANGSEGAKRFADYITKIPGGRGAVRETIEMLLDAKGLDPVDLWLTDKDRGVGKQ